MNTPVQYFVRVFKFYLSTTVDTNHIFLNNARETQGSGLHMVYSAVAS
jgi:hypothetical protein